MLSRHGISSRDLERNQSYTVGSTRTFWVDDGPNGNNGEWEQIPATLRAVGDNSYIWIHDDNFDNSSTTADDNLLNTAQAEEMRDAFELLYPEVTNLFGYELGGGPDGDGGMDGDTRISILFYDVENDYELTQSGGVLGYFWGKDDFAQKATQGLASPIWFNEMLSMLAEDYLSETLDTTLYSSHPSGRISQYNDGYVLSGIVDWGDAWNVLYSYASSYLFGGFLARNYGGAELLYQLSTNNAAGINSINAALDYLGYSETFDDVVSEYAKLHVFPTGHADIEYDFTGSSQTYNGITYNIPAFDLFAVGDGPHVLDIADPGTLAVRPYGFQVWYSSPGRI